MNIENLPDDSESSDEDYVPNKANDELPSEEESDGDAEDDLPPEEHLGKRSKRQSKTHAKKVKSDKNEAKSVSQDSSISKEQSNSLWADFIKDTGFKTRAELKQVSSQPNKVSEECPADKPKESKIETSKSVETLKVTEVFKFAGEEVEVEKEIKVNEVASKMTPSGSIASKNMGSSRLTSLIGQLGKTRKITTLEKSKLDWDKYKKDESIEEELRAYSKSKDGYLEKQDFLQRADLRRFEMEKDIRNSLRRMKD